MEGIMGEAKFQNGHKEKRPMSPIRRKSINSPESKIKKRGTALLAEKEASRAEVRMRAVILIQVSLFFSINFVI